MIIALAAIAIEFLLWPIRNLTYRLGVPYHAWRITHAQHHAATGHMTQDQVFVPRTRSELGLPEFDPSKEDLAGSSVTEEVKRELWEALGDSPIGAVYGSMRYLVSALPIRAIAITELDCIA